VSVYMQTSKTGLTLNLSDVSVPAAACMRTMQLFVSPSTCQSSFVSIDQPSPCAKDSHNTLIKECGFRGENPIEDYLSGQAHFQVVTVHFDSLQHLISQDGGGVNRKILTVFSTRGGCTEQKKPRRYTPKLETLGCVQRRYIDDMVTPIDDRPDPKVNIYSQSHTKLKMGLTRV
jgi:hypothetical protein